MLLSLYSLSRRSLALLAVVGLGGVALEACKGHEAEAQPERGTDYFPVAVNNSRTYLVTDTTWVNFVPTVTPAYQVRERVLSTFTDAAGQTVYRIEHSRKAAGATAFVADSVFTLSATAQTVVQTRSNRRTIELVFPVRDSYVWNFGAYDNAINDTITAENRRYHRLGQPYTVAPVGNPTQTFAATVVTDDEGLAAEDNQCNLRGYRQVFAKGIGPVLRVRRNFVFNAATGVCIRRPGVIYFGRVHRETLIDYSPR